MNMYQLLWMVISTVLLAIAVFAPGLWIPRERRERRLRQVTFQYQALGGYRFYPFWDWRASSHRGSADWNSTRDHCWQLKLKDHQMIGGHLGVWLGRRRCRGWKFLVCLDADTHKDQKGFIQVHCMQPTFWHPLALTVVTFIWLNLLFRVPPDTALTQSPLQIDLHEKRVTLGDRPPVSLDLNNPQNLIRDLAGLLFPVVPAA